MRSKHAKTHLQNSSNPKIIMDARTIDNLEAADPSPETTELIQRWRDIVKPGIYRLTGATSQNSSEAREK